MRKAAFAAVVLLCAIWARATPANKAALDRHFDGFLAKNLSACTTCHLPSDKKDPQNLDEFPHNPFGARLRALKKELAAAGKPTDIPARISAIANEDSDGDGVDNLTEILLGHGPGNAADKPSEAELKNAPAKLAEFSKFLASYRWRPFEPVTRPPVPAIQNNKWVRNPIDIFIAAEQEQRSLRPRSEAPKQILLRRVYLDLIGLVPTPAAYSTDSLTPSTPMSRSINESASARLQKGASPSHVAVRQSVWHK